jgi:enamine deaminase RidA (YjgF/YER057c/UK114 family)
MNRMFNPPSIATPVGAYTHGVEVPPGARWLTIAGQVGVKPDGALGKTIDEQCEWTLHNLLAVLREGNMAAPDIVKLFVCLVDRAHLQNWRAARTKVLGDVKPASTLVFVAGLYAPECLVEADAWAAKV